MTFIETHPNILPPLESLSYSSDTRSCAYTNLDTQGERFSFPIFNFQNLDTVQITDSNGIPLPGVNVYSKGNMQKGTTSDFDGYVDVTGFDQNDIIVFSFAGTAKEFPRGLLPGKITLGSDTLPELVIEGAKKKKFPWGLVAFGVLGIVLLSKTSKPAPGLNGSTKPKKKRQGKKKKSKKRVIHV